MSRIIESCTLESRADRSAAWERAGELTQVEWTGFAPAGCGVDQGRVIATPAGIDGAALDPDAPDRWFRLIDADGGPLFEFLGFADDRRPRRKGAIVLGISTTPTLMGAWEELQPARA